MAKPEWGMKRVCASCGARFYDLRRTPIVCPKCGAAFDPEQMTRLKRTRGAAEEQKKLVAAPEADETLEAVGDEDMEEAAEEDDAVLEDASDLTDGEDEFDELMEVDKEKED